MFSSFIEVVWLVEGKSFVFSGEGVYLMSCMEVSERMLWVCVDV